MEHAFLLGLHSKDVIPLVPLPALQPNPEPILCQLKLSGQQSSLTRLYRQRSVFLRQLSLLKLSLPLLQVFQLLSYWLLPSLTREREVFQPPDVRPLTLQQFYLL